MNQPRTEDIEGLRDALRAYRRGHDASVTTSECRCEACDTARRYLASPVAPTEGHVHEFKDETRMLVGQNFEVRSCRCGQIAPTEGLATPGIAALPALGVERLAEELFNDESNIGNLGNPFLSRDACRVIAARIASKLATTTEETTDGPA